MMTSCTIAITISAITCVAGYEVNTTKLEGGQHTSCVAGYEKVLNKKKKDYLCTICST